MPQLIPSFKPLSLTEVRSRAREFVSDWQGEGLENAEAQPWWNDFFGIFGMERRQVATFERWAKRESTGNKGRLNVFMPHVMIAEHKSLGKDEGAAHGQALDYLQGGDIKREEFPRYIVSCDFGAIELRDLESDDQPLRFPLKDLPKHIQRFAFLGGYGARWRESLRTCRGWGGLWLHDDGLAADTGDRSGDPRLLGRGAPLGPPRRCRTAGQENGPLGHSVIRISRAVPRECRLTEVPFR